MARKSDKRERLLEGAIETIYQRGFNQTTLADIADVSGVQLGNFYYYFKTKDEIVEAVIAERRGSLLSTYAEWDKLPSPKVRIKAFLNTYIDDAENLTANGCPLGGLSFELNKREDVPDLVDKVEKLFSLHLQWLTHQFKLMRKAKAEEFADEFYSTIQGAILLANCKKDSRIIKNQINRLIKLVDRM